MTQKKTIYQEGLQSWEKVAECLLQAIRSQCPVCDQLNCGQHRLLGKTYPSKNASDCPIVENKELCQKMHRVRNQIEDARKDALKIVQELNRLHKEKGLLK